MIGQDLHDEQDEKRDSTGPSFADTLILSIMIILSKLFSASSGTLRFPPLEADRTALACGYRFQTLASHSLNGFNVGWRQTAINLPAPPFGLIAFPSFPELHAVSMTQESPEKETSPLLRVALTLAILPMTCIVVSPIAFLLLSNFRGKGVAAIVVLVAAPVFFGFVYFAERLTGIKPMGLNESMGTRKKSPPRERTDNGPPCPTCGKPLRTAAAKMCIHCGADWH